MKPLSLGEGSCEPVERLQRSEWSRFNEEEMAQRLKIIKEQIYLDSLAHRRTPESGTVADVLAKSFAYALEDIPTMRLQECFTRAIRAQTDDFPLPAAAVTRAYEELKPELLRRAQTEDAYLLPRPQGGAMTITQFKERHNLPDSWKLGDPYPETSDLHGAPVPLNSEQTRLFDCFKCKDAGWTRIPFDIKTLRPAQLVRCECSARTDD